MAKWSGIQMLFEYWTKPPFEYRTSIQMVVWISNYHLNTNQLTNGQVHYSDVCYSEGYEIQASLDFEWSKRGWFVNSPDFHWIWNPEAQSFEIQTNSRNFVYNHLKSGQKCLDLEWASFLMVGTIAIAKAQPFENRTIWNLIFKKSGFQMRPDFEWWI